MMVVGVGERDIMRDGLIAHELESDDKVAVMQAGDDEAARVVGDGALDGLLILRDYDIHIGERLSVGVDDTAIDGAREGGRYTQDKCGEERKNSVHLWTIKMEKRGKYRKKKKKSGDGMGEKIFEINNFRDELGHKRWGGGTTREVFDNSQAEESHTIKFLLWEGPLRKQNAARKRDKELNEKTANDVVRLFLMLDEFIPLGENVDVNKQIHNAEWMTIDVVRQKYKWLQKGGNI